MPPSLNIQRWTSALRHAPFTLHLGLLPVIIILWAWVDSRQYETTWWWQRAPLHEESIEFSLSAIDWRDTFITADVERDLLSRYPTSARQGNRRTRMSGHQHPWFPPPSSRWHGTAEHSIRIHARTIPFWLILAAYLPLWLLIVFLHARHRRHRKLAITTDPP